MKNYIMYALFTIVVSIFNYMGADTDGLLLVSVLMGFLIIIGLLEDIKKNIEKRGKA